MDGQDLLHRLGFNQDAAGHQQIKSQRFFASEALVFDQYCFLADSGQPALFKLFAQTPFVDGFNQARSLVAMDFDGCADDGFCQVGCLFKQGVHNLELEKEGTEKMENIFHPFPFVSFEQLGSSLIGWLSPEATNGIKQEGTEKTERKIFCSCERAANDAPGLGT